MTACGVGSLAEPTPHAEGGETIADAPDNSDERSNKQRKQPISKEEWIAKQLAKAPPRSTQWVRDVARIYGLDVDPGNDQHEPATDT